MSADENRHQLLFRYLNGEIGFEEWQKLHEQHVEQRPHKDHAVAAKRIDPVGTQPRGATNITKDPEPCTSKSTANVPPTADIEIKEEPIDPPNLPRSGPPEVITIDVDDDIILIDTDTTMKYLSGDLPFERYHSLLQRNVIKDEAEDVPESFQEMDIGAEEEVEEDNEDDDEGSESDEEVLREPKKQTKEKPGFRKGGRKKGQLGRKKSQLTLVLQGLMGEANMNFAKGNYEEAVRMCMEIIRQEANAHEPFHLLGMIYEELEDTEKALQFYMIAAHLNPTDAEEWAKLAEMSLDFGKVNEAIICYDKAVKNSKDNKVEYLLAKCGLCEKNGDTRKMFEAYYHLLKVLPKENAEKYVILARDITKKFHEYGNTDKALSTLETTFELCPHSVSAEDLNLILDLYFAEGKYEQSLEILLKHCGVTLTLLSGENISGVIGAPLSMALPCTSTVTICYVPEDLMIDLRTKLMVCLIHLNQTKCLAQLTKDLFSVSVDEIGDLYLDVAEAYMEKGFYTECKPILATLVNSEKYNLAAVWLRYGECLNALGEVIHAAEAFQKVVELAPTHAGARVTLSALQQQLGRHDEALEVLQRSTGTGEESQPTVDLQLMFPRCLLLYSQGHHEEFIESAERVLFGHFKSSFNKSHMNVIIGNRSVKHRLEALRHIMGNNLDQIIKEGTPVSSGAGITANDMFELFLKLGDVLVKMKKFSEFFDVACCALIYPPFINDTEISKDCDFVALVACMLTKNGHYAYTFIRDICIKESENPQAWNLFNQIISMTQDIRHNRFCLRLMIKKPDNLALAILNGHNAMVAGSYKHALGEYVTALKKSPRDPLISLCLGMTFIHISSQKFASRRHSLVIQACAFLNQYLELRGECQESYFNCGRAMHQIGLFHAAIYYYEKALEFGPVLPDQPELTDLSKEIAFNLALIYRMSGSEEYAARIYQKYLQF